MGLLLTALSFALVLWSGWRSLGRGLAATTAVGFFYGILRGRYPDGMSHFMFDAALLALYVTVFRRPASPEAQRNGLRLKSWVTALMVWPLVSILVSILLPQAQPVLVQIVGLRASVLFVPMLLVGARMQPEDFEVLYRTAAALVIVAFVFGALEMKMGIEPFFPDNDITRIIYVSNDVASGFHRIPATFSSAHAYAGTMVALLPLIAVWRKGTLSRILGVAAMACAVLGIFMSGARGPVVQVGLILLLLALTTRLPARWMLSIIPLTLIVALVVSQSERLRRFETLSDVDYVENRIGWSLNKSLLDVVLEYPMGAGLGSAAGTSIPFFLQDEALPQIGLENEYARIALEQGVMGLLLWTVFLLWMVVRRPRGRPGWAPLQLRMMWILSIVCWASAFTGTGILTSIPGTMILMLQMGLVGASPAPGRERSPAWTGPPAAARRWSAAP